MSEPAVPMTQQPLRASDLDYELPHELIATRPAEPRDAARLLVVSRTGDRVDHVHVRDLPAYLDAGDAIVFNTTAVIPARLCGTRVATGGGVDGLFIEETGPGLWLVMLSRGGRLKAGDVIDLGSGVRLTLSRRHPEGWIVETGTKEPAAAVLARAGRTPLPPYILRARRGAETPDALDRAWYQTIYAATTPTARHSVAAPTAGLHFTPDLLERLRAAGVERIDVTLHVGPGTFRPITAEVVADHVMHSEAYSVSAEAVEALRRARARGGRILAVGSTAVRTLETLPEGLPPGAVSGRTDLLIAPPYAFRLVDAFLTNFHLPRTTLLALVAACLGVDRVREVYREAVRQKYRFYSYGDAMLILP